MILHGLQAGPDNLSFLLLGRCSINCLHPTLPVSTFGYMAIVDAPPGDLDSVDCHSQMSKDVKYVRYT